MRGATHEGFLRKTYGSEQSRGVDGQGDTHRHALIGPCSERSLILVAAVACNNGKRHNSRVHAKGADLHDSTSLLDLLCIGRNEHGQDLG